MMVDLERGSIQDRFKHLFSLISSERFLKMQGLGNEVPFFICPYRAEEGIEISRMQKQLTNRLEQNGVPILEINLYDLAIELLKSRNIWERTLEAEQTVSKAELLEHLQGVLDAEAHLIPAIGEKMSMAEFKVMFINGVGEVYPYVRSHNILNNLQSMAKDQPTVMFFPGSYTHSLADGTSLDLFGRLHDDKYYRAFNIYHCEI